jgi:hypothetical protein
MFFLFAPTEKDKEFIVSKSGFLRLNLEIPFGERQMKTKISEIVFIFFKLSFFSPFLPLQDFHFLKKRYLKL